MSDTISSSTNTTGTLAVNRSVTSSIDFSGDVDWWKVNLAHGYQYQIWLEGLSLNRHQFSRRLLALQ
jgi:hypothetical protein